MKIPGPAHITIKRAASGGVQADTATHDSRHGTHPGRVFSAGLAVVLFLVCAFPALAGSAVRISDLKHDAEAPASFRFPYIDTGNADTNRAINALLQIDMLKKAQVDPRGNPFDQLNLPTTYMLTTSLGYRVHAQTPAFVSLAIEADQRPSYKPDSDPVHSRTHYSFDLNSGLRFGTSELMERASYARFSERVSNVLRERMRRLLQPPPEKSAYADGTIADAEIHLLARCREPLLISLMEFKAYKAPLFESEIWLSTDSLHIDLSRHYRACNDDDPRALATLDAAGVLDVAFAYTDIADLLSPYGRCLLLAQRDDCVNLHPLLVRRALHGRIGEHEVTMLLNRINPGVYFYDRIGKPLWVTFPIPEDGQQWPIGMKLGLTAKISPNDEEEIFDLQVGSDGTLSGTWRKNRSSQPLPVLLH